MVYLLMYLFVVAQRSDHKKKHNIEADVYLIFVFCLKIKSMLAVLPVLYIAGSSHCVMFSPLKHWQSGFGKLKNCVSGSG